MANFGKYYILVRLQLLNQYRINQKSQTSFRDEAEVFTNSVSWT